jgi:hypothetical protein
MKRVLIPGFLIILFGLLTISGCGGSSGGSAPPPAAASVPSSASATKAIITLSTRGTLTAPALIGSIDGVVNLPANVTVKASAQGSLITDTSVVSAVGAAAGAEKAQYIYGTSATGSTHTVHVFIAKTAGFPTGDFATVICDIASGSSPPTADFSLAGFTVVDNSLSGLALSGLTVNFNVVLQ